MILKLVSCAQPLVGDIFPLGFTIIEVDGCSIGFAIRTAMFSSKFFSRNLKIDIGCSRMPSLCAAQRSVGK